MQFLEQAEKSDPGAAHAVSRREVRAPVKGLPLGREEDAHRPAAVLREELHGLHVDGIDVGALFAIDLDRHEEAVEHLGDLEVLERLLLHDVAPVARRVAHGEEDRHVALARLREGLVAPGTPVDRVVRVLQQIRARLQGEPVHELGTALGSHVTRPWRLGTARGCLGQPGGEGRGTRRSARR